MTLPFSTRPSVQTERIDTACEDGTVRVWSVETGLSLTPPLTHADLAMWVEFDATGRRLVTTTESTDEGVIVWESATGKKVAAFPQFPAVFRGSFCPDGKRVLGAGRRGASLWDATSRTRLFQSSEAADVLDARFSPDGERVLTAGFDRTARLWDTRSGRTIGVAMLADNAVQWAAFSRDGARVVTAGVDSNARLWDGFTGQPLTAPFHARVLFAAFSPDGDHVVTCGNDKTARLWPFLRERRSALRLTDLAAVVSGRKFDSSSALVPLSPEETERIWKRLRPQEPENGIDAGRQQPQD
jgi:WD40 repeat protein